MGLLYEELDERTRERMVYEFDVEQAGSTPFIGRDLSPRGRVEFAILVRTAIDSGTDDTLIQSLDREDYWEEFQNYTRSGVVRQRRINVPQRATGLGLTEFNTWYVRGLSGRLSR